jgi:uncharacterized protein YbcI
MSAASDRPSVLQDVANEMVRVYKEQFGRGPTRSSAHWCGGDTLTVILEDTFTPAERNLASIGEHERLREMRGVFQYSYVSDFCDPIERLTGRRVRAFISGVDTEVQGASTETFLLHPEGSDEPSRAHVSRAQVALRSMSSTR